MARENKVVLVCGGNPTAVLDEDVTMAANSDLYVPTQKAVKAFVNDTKQATTIGVGAKNGATVTVAEYGNGVIQQTVLTCTATPITIEDDAGVAQYGGVKVYDFPLGMICTLGAVVSGTLTAGVTGTITDNWDGDVALGTATATTGATLTGTEADILQSTAVSAGNSDKIGVVSAFPVATALTESGARWHNGTGTAKDLFLNFVIDDSGTHTAGTAAFTGTITLTWINLGAL